MKIRDLFFSGMTHQATYCQAPASFIISTALIGFLLFTATVNFYCLVCLLLLCLWGYSISLRQGATTDIVSLCIRSTSHHMTEHPLGVAFSPLWLPWGCSRILNS